MPAFSAFPLASDVHTDAKASSAGVDESRYRVVAMAGKLRDAEEELGAALRLVFTCLIKSEEAA